jgi:uncharacterized protein
MPTFNKRTPGVYIEEISIFPPSVTAVETAIPVFIGFTEKAEGENGESLKDKPTRITSLLEFERFYGKANIQDFTVKVKQTGTGIAVNFATPPAPPPPPPPEPAGEPATAQAPLPSHFLYYSMQLFFANGGGPCYIISVGDYKADKTKQVFENAISLLESHDEPTLLVFPDACLLQNDTDHGDVASAALKHCHKMQDRFTIMDVRNAIPGGTAQNKDVNDNFREKVKGETEQLKYGAAYFPYVRTSLPFHTEDANIKIIFQQGIDDNIKDKSLADIKTSHTAVYNAIKQFVGGAAVTIPSSGGVAGIYARTDKNRGVWKAPANAALLNVIEPAVMITDDLNGDLNVDATTGKSVNAIRSFVGKGPLVWGARTLAGNDNENRYVPVRRFLIFAEESIKKATVAFVFEPNDANTWVKVRSMIESFLIKQWRDGALAGAKPEDAFYVSVGLNKTMSAQDILEGYMIVEIGLAIVRPAEFIILRFAQKMQQS